MAQKYCFNLNGNTDAIVDIGGWYSDATVSTGSRSDPVSPSRVCDTRQPGPGIPSNQCSSNGITQGGTINGLAVEWGLELLSADRDFARYPGLRWRAPFPLCQSDLAPRGPRDLASIVE